MKHRHLGMLLAVFFSAVALPAQVGKQEPAKPNPLVPDKIKELKGYAKKRGKADTEAVKVVEELSGIVLKGCDKDKKTVAKELGSILAGRTKRKPHDTALFVACMETLSSLGKFGSPYLLKAAEGKKFKGKEKKKWLDMRMKLVRALGKTKDASKIKPLSDLMLRAPDDQINAAAIEALANFSGEKQKVRRDIVEDIVRLFSDVTNMANATEGNDFQTEAYRQKRTLIAGPCNNTLKALTGQSFTKAIEWLKWFQNNKNKKSWGKKKKGK